MSEVAIITSSDLSMVEDNSLNTKQLQYLLAKTPSTYIRERPAKGGGKWKYVSGSYIRKVLNLMFGWDWDFQIIESSVIHGEVVVLGKLTCRANGREIVKMQYGNKEVVCRRGTDIPLSIGNDMKAAATDALKKCATELGIAQDVYSPDEFKAVKIQDDKPINQEKERVELLINNCKTLEELSELSEAAIEYGLTDLFDKVKTILK